MTTFSVAPVAVIIPTLDEARELERCLPAVVKSASEVVVTDGGSRDGTPETARRLGATVVSGERGRGLQLNRGAAATSARTLLFLHADTELPTGALEKVVEATDADAIGGGFQIHFGSENPIYRVGSTVVNLRSRLFKTPLGDQAQFASRSSFEELGGYPDWPILEDLEFIRRLKKKGKIAILSPAVTTSARRFEEGGIARTLLLNWWIFALYYAGVSPERLARLYRDIR